MKKLNATIFGVTAMVAMVCLLTAGQAMAFNQAHLDNLLMTKECIQCNLSGANLSGADWPDGRRCAEGSIGECK